MIELPMFVILTGLAFALIVQSCTVIVMLGYAMFSSVAGADDIRGWLFAAALTFILVIGPTWTAIIFAIKHLE